jgi:hypothetical protein
MGGLAPRNPPISPSTAHLLRDLEAQFRLRASIASVMRFGRGMDLQSG